MDAQGILDLSRWIAEAGLRGVPETDLIGGFCERLVAAGVPLTRTVVGADTLHPTIAGHVVTWDSTGRNAAEVRQTDYGGGDGDPDIDEKWLRSPFHRLYTSGETMLRLRLTDAAEGGEFPVIEELRAQGATDYMAIVNRLGPRAAIGELDCIFSSWVSHHPDGFSDAQRDAMLTLTGTLALALRGHAMAHIANTLAETYLGRDAGHRVLRGHIRRGVAEELDAVLWFSDLQGYTRITDTAAPEVILPLLNDYAELVVTAIHRHRGQVLKFIGDGILAVFDRSSAGDACRAALDAAEEARERCKELNSRRSAAGLPVTRFYLGLHQGKVFYGNIGGVDRLDFTVVGPAVNEASRIAAMCRSLDQDILLSSAFAESAPDCRERLISVGRYLLRGVGRPQELYTLDPEAPSATP
ncbi:adenylate/guanylate cyclase domain-containing protein [Azospirillum isscasi]|uniref:Adenylate/guanylate cyclase domain-containing protein n=1 Tax=Azospirillum isscasi TaxID=3053926 RepID=A0ABU0WJ91_9PROT|nr:adenylate/guanylate cyclase domain-containing protein [Azospirillum isscasi]MDQ2103927.1 adenylate/guanylate cyclase domain-containing protein [Azospirillum isscasi]